MCNPAPPVAGGCAPYPPPANIRSTATSASTRVIPPLRRSPLPPLLLAPPAGALLLLFFALESGGELRFYDPATGRHIATLAGERPRANAERGDRAVADARVRELEEQLVDWESATP